MKRLQLNRQNGAVLAALLIASCSQGPTGPSARTAAAPSAGVADGLVRGSAAGDVKVGPVDMDISLIRVAQTNGVQAFYASPNGEYIVLPGRLVEIYVQIWNSNPAVQNPRLIVDWGGFVNDKDNTGCGSCRLTRTYNTEGKYKVSVTLDDRVSSFTTRTFTLNVRNPETGGTFNFSNSGLITINDDLPATPYPSTIGVSGIAGKITNATVTIAGYSHTFHSDVAIVLVAPGGQTVRLMAGTGSGFDGNNATITFQDGAPPFPSANIGPGSFTFAPSGVTAFNAYAPAPPGPYGATLSVLNGADPNGSWRLFVGDYAGEDIGQLAGGWSLTLTTATSSSSAGTVVRSSTGEVSASDWPSNDYILNYPFQKPNPEE